MHSAVETRPTHAESIDQKGRSVLEGLARAARQISLYGPEHPIAARALQDAYREISAEATRQELLLEVEEEGLRWNGKLAPRGSLHLQRLHEVLRERLTASLRFTSRFDLPGLSRLLSLLTEDPKLLVSSGGMMRAYGPEGPPGILIEDIDFTRELRECEASWVEVCAQVDPQAVAPLREILESCLHIVRSASDDLTLAEMRETLAEDPPEEDDTVSPVEAIASTLAALVQSAGEIAIHTGVARRQAWESSILRQFEVLGPRWGAYIFRAPTTVTAGTPDILSLLAREMIPGRAVSLILDYPGGIVTERSEGLALALRRILSDPATAPRVERELHAQATSRGISEEVYRNVVGLLRPDLAKLTRSDGMWRLLDGGEESWRAEDPKVELADLLETTSPSALRRSRASMLSDLLNAEMNASQYGSVVKALVELSEHCLRYGETDLLLSSLESLQREASESGGRSSGRRAIAAGALTRSATPDTISTLMRELERSLGEPRSRLMRLLAQLGEGGLEALLGLAKRTHDVDSAEALQVLVQQDGPAYSHLRQILSELTLADLPPVLRTLLNTKDPVVVAQLNALTSHPDPEIRLALIRALEESRAAAGAEVARQLLADSEVSVRLTAAEALGRLGMADAVPALCYLLGRESGFGQGARVKAAAARALGEIRSPKAIPSLSEMLFHGGLLSRLASREPQFAAARALAHIATPEARQALRDWRRCHHHDVREACQRALRELGESLPGSTEGARHVR